MTTYNHVKNVFAILFGLVLTSSVVLHETYAQTIRYVTVIGAGSKNGTTWGNAYDSTQLQTAINESGITQVWVAKGTYRPTTPVGGVTDRYKAFQMKNSVSIYGGFAGTETLLSQRNISSNKTILSGDLNGNGKDVNDSYHVFNNPSGLTSSDTLDGFTITGGNADGTANYGAGGGMINPSTSPTLTNCTFTSNSATNGGGMYNETSSSPTLTNCTFTSNTSVSIGGGMYNFSSSSPTLTNCTFTSNSATDGGGMYNEFSSSPTLRNCIVWGNTASTAGNQFYINEGTTTLNYSCYGTGARDVSIDSVYGGTFTPDAQCITLNPQFVGASNNAAHPYSIMGTSPCADVGNNAYISESYDIRGSNFARMLNKISGSAGTVDMGAYEYKVSVDVLPVELSSFCASVKSNLVNLQWYTLTELENFGFEVERRTIQNSEFRMQNGEWERIGFVAGAGTSNAPKEYSFTDAKLSSGRYAYRVKQIDNDGSYTYSMTAEVEVGVAEKVLSLSDNYPNPFNPSTLIEFTLPKDGRATLKIYNTIGQEVANLFDGEARAGYVIKGRFDAKSLATGLYFARLQFDGKMLMKKMLFVK